MKTMMIAFASIMLIAIAADLGLHEAGFSAAEQFSMPSVRLGE